MQTRTAKFCCPRPKQRQWIFALLTSPREKRLGVLGEVGPVIAVLSGRYEVHESQLLASTLAESVITGTHDLGKMRSLADEGFIKKEKRGSAGSPKGDWSGEDMARMTRKSSSAVRKGGQRCTVPYCDGMT